MGNSKIVIVLINFRHNCQNPENSRFILTLSRLERKKPSQYVNMTTSLEVQLLSIVLFVFGRLLRTL